MKHNLPFYGQKVSVIITVEGDPSVFYISVQKWMEQIYRPYSVIVIDLGCRQNLRSFLTKLSHNHGKSFSCSTDLDLDTDVSLVEMQQWEKQEALDFVANKINSPAVCYAPINHVPSAYFLDVAMIALQPNTIAYRDKCTIRPNNVLLNPKSIFLTPGTMLAPEDQTVHPKVTVFIPSMDREANLKESLPHWFAQRYSNWQICVIDYSSKVPILSAVESVCYEHNKTLSTDMKSNADVIVHRIEGVDFFNISHAYNHAISRAKTDIVCTACADSVPWDYYLEAVMSTLNSNNIVQVHWGLHTLTYQNWKSLNGHQEFIVGWGAEDDDFRVRATLMGLTPVIIPSKLVFQIPTDNEVKSKNRQIKDLSESSLVNLARFQKYIADHGYVGNYKMEIGTDTPIEYQDSKITPPLRLWCFKNSSLDKQNLPPEIQYSETFDMFYHVGNTDFDCGAYSQGPYDHFFVGAELDIDKYLFQCRQK